MTPRRHILLVRSLLGFGVAALLGGQAADAAIYPTNKCVGRKQLEAGKYCQAVLKAWSKWENNQNDAARDAAIQSAGERLADRWAWAEEDAFAAGVDCADTTLSSAEAQSLIDDAAGGIAAAINSGLDLGMEAQAECGHELLDAAAVKCKELLEAESEYIRELDRDPDAVRRDRFQRRAAEKFSREWRKEIRRGCPTDATEQDIEGRVDTTSADIVLNTTVSPNVDDTQFTTYAPTDVVHYQGRDFTPICVKGDPYYYFAKRGSVNKLVMYYVGGGACWENLTCFVETCDTNVNPAGGDNPNNRSTGFADLTNPANPFKDWHIVVVSYCSCDIHYGDAAQDYEGLFPTVHAEHRGFHNAKVVEKWAREHFLNPEAVFVSGTSAGAYGAVFHAPLLHEVWPASEFHVLGDAGNGVITPEFLQNEFGNWNFTANLPPDIPGVVESITEGTGMVGYIEAVATFFPNSNWAHYTTAFDGGSGGQTGFYNIMLNDNDPLAGLTWWEGSCAFNEVMRQQAFDTAALVPSNYRYYIGTGSRHGMWGHDKVYTDTTGGVPTIVEWINAMMDSGPDWTNVEADPFNVLLPGDPKPDPLEPPFEQEQEGSDIVISCPPLSPSGAFLEVTGSLLD